LSVSKINNLEIKTDNFKTDGSQKSGAQSFKDMLKSALKKTNELQNDYDSTISMLINGQDINLHNVIIAGEKAKLSLELTLQIRNKAIEAYQEVMRMQV
jgi:flagellar hook-basal body complex protein FliE